ncbi:chaplin [Streptomyces albus subsp. albus]|nr:chaplin [Streptomyces albus subsp. albus]
MKNIKKIAAITIAAGGLAIAGAGVASAATGSPGVVSGNEVQVPVKVGVHVCDNSVSVIGSLNPALGGSCANR